MNYRAVKHAETHTEPETGLSYFHGYSFFFYLDRRICFQHSHIASSTMHGNTCMENLFWPITSWTANAKVKRG